MSTVYTAWRRWADDQSLELINVFAAEQSAKRECERLARMMGGDQTTWAWRHIQPVAILSFAGESPFEVRIHEVQP